MRQVDNNHGAGFGIADSENELLRARLAFDEGLQAATEAVTQSRAAARRLVVPAVWGAVAVAGAVALFAVARLMRRRHRGRALIRIVVEPARAERSLARTAGAALARLAIQRLLSSVSDAGSAHASAESVSGERPAPLGSDHLGPLDSSVVQRNATTDGRQLVD